MEVWVEIGVAKHRGAVLEDAISVVQYRRLCFDCCKMGKFNCYVPGCTNNWRNSPNIKFHTLPSDPKIRRSYEKIVRNENLKLNSQNTIICGEHFPSGEGMCRTQLPSIFFWTVTPQKRRVIEKHELPLKTKKIRKSLNPCELGSKDVVAEESDNLNGDIMPLTENTVDVNVVACSTTKDQACQTEDTTDVKDLKDIIATLKERGIEEEHSRNELKAQI